MSRLSGGTSQATAMATNSIRYSRFGRRMGNFQLMKMATQDAREHAEEGERVDQPGRAEEQAEADQAAGLEQQERDAQDEEVGAEPPEAGARGGRRERHRDEAHRRRMMARATR